MSEESKKGPGSRFVHVDPKALEQFLQEKGFSRGTQGSEVVYTINNRYHKSAKVKVYTTIRTTDQNMRDCGDDAIRVCAVYIGDKAIPRRGKVAAKSFGIYRSMKILRAGTEEAIFERLYDRMQEAYLATNVWLRKHWREVTENSPAEPPK